MFEWNVEQKASNAILLDDNVGGKGKIFQSRFLQAGLVKYSFGVCLLENEVINKFVHNFVGCPVIINHKDVTSDSAKDDRVGVISDVWFNNNDGWFYCKGVIFEQEAIDLIDKGFNVSCQYEITEYSENRENKLHNGNKYDKTILNGKPEHLAIVKNPRYEMATIAVNAMEVDVASNEGKKEFVTVGEGEGKHAIPVEYLDKDKKEKSKEEKKSEFDEIYQKMITPTVEKQLLESVKAQKAENPAAKVGDTVLDSDRIISLYADKLTSSEYNKFNFDKAEDILFNRLHEIEKDVFKSEKLNKIKGEKTYKEVAKKDSIQLSLFSKNDIIQAINEIKESNMFKKLFKKEEKMDKEEMKSIFMECLTELTATNEAEKEEKEEKEENKCKNEEPDYKKMYEELKAECEAKKEKAQNSVDEQMKAFCKEVKFEGSSYITEAKAIELGDKLF